MKLSQLDLLADEIISHEKILTNSHNKQEIAHSERKIEALCATLTGAEMLELDEIIQKKLNK